MSGNEVKKDLEKKQVKTADSNKTVKKQVKKKPVAQNSADGKKPVAKKAPAEGAKKPVAKKAPVEGAKKPAAKKAPAEGAKKPVAKKAPAEGAKKPAVKKASAEGAKKPVTKKVSEETKKPETKKVSSNTEKKPVIPKAEKVQKKEETKKKEPVLQDLPEEPPKKKGVALKILGGLVAIVAVAYLGMSGYCYSHFYPFTKINGTEFSMSNVSQVESQMEKQVNNYKLTLVESDGDKEEISGSDISIKYVPGDDVKKVLNSQNPFLWVTSLFKTPEIEAQIGVEYDEALLKKKIEGLTCMKEEEQEASVSAHPEFKETQFEIVPEKIGTKIDEDLFVEAVETAVAGFQSELNMEEAGCYIPPKYLKDAPEVKEAMDKMNSYLGANITLDLSPDKVVVDSKQISEWITCKKKNMSVTFDENKVHEFVASLAEKYDTAGKTRSFVTGYGSTVNVDGGIFGWKIDQDKEVAALLDNIKKAETVEREPVYASRGYTHEGNDFGKTYVEVDLTNQHVFFFKDGGLVTQSDCVTGNPFENNATPGGVYTIAYKARDQVLRGPKMPDGEYKWESPVAYWMPFNGGIGLHDAPWRGSFGGSIYRGGGSHGCVNLPPSFAAQLYDLVDSGTPVVLHY